MQSYISLFPWYLASGALVLGLALLADCVITVVKAPDCITGLSRVLNELKKIEPKKKSSIIPRIMNGLTLLWYVISWPYQAIYWMLIISNGETVCFRIYKQAEKRIKEAEKRSDEPQDG